MTAMFEKATKKKAKLRMAIDGPSGSGKTYTALIAANALANGGKIAVIDTERGSASLYSDHFNFDVCELHEFSPAKYVEAIEAAEGAGYAVIVIDSLSHAWEGEGGALDMVEDARRRQKVDNSFTAWKDVTPLHRKLVDAMLQSPAHIIATMRSKTEYVLEQIERQGRTVSVPKKIGMAPIQRQGMEYEFTIVGDMDLDHTLVISKSRMENLADKVENKPGDKFFKQILDWLDSGEGPAPASTPAPEKPEYKVLIIPETVEMKTPKGTLLGSLSDEQLKTVAEKATNGIQEAAKFLLQPAFGDDWKPWYYLVDRAGTEKQIFPEDLPTGITRIGLWRACLELKKAVEA